MERSRDDDLASQASEVATLPPISLAVNAHADQASDGEDDWDIISERVGKTPDPHNNTDPGKSSDAASDAMMESCFSLDTEEYSQPLSSVSRQVQVQKAISELDEDMFKNDQGDDELCSESKQLRLDDEEDAESLSLGAKISKTEEADDDISSKGSPQSPVLREDYMMHSMLMTPFLDLTEEVEAEPIVPPDELTDYEEEMLTLREAVRMSPPPEISSSSSAATQAGASCYSLSDCLDRLSEGRCGCESVTPMSSAVKVAITVVMGVILWTTLSGGYSECPTSNERLKRQRVQSQMEVPSSFVNSFSREVSLCEGTCCFNLFILTGDSAAHEHAVKHAMRSSKRWKGAVDPKLNVWSAQRLMEWTEGYSADDKEEVVLVQNADVLETRQVQRAIKYGQRRCRHSRRSKSRFVVLSTSFGSDKLTEPDDVLSDKFVQDFEQRDWLTVPEIVLNRHGIVHGIRGKRPQRVFEEYLRAHRHSSKSSPHNHDGLAQWLLAFASRFWSRKIDEMKVPQSPAQFLDSWLETKRGDFVWTENAKKVLTNQVHQYRMLSQARMWLESQYAVWTKNGSCESVLFRSGRSDVRAYNVACGPATMTGAVF